MQPLKMNSAVTSLCFTVFIAFSGVSTPALLANEPPNVILFLMDDMGYGDCRAYNADSKVALPNLEQLATDGMLFTDAHSPSSVCAPTRYSVLTGNYPYRGRLENGTWIFHQPSQVLDGQRTIGHLMKNAGYHTAFLGKVHLGGQMYSKTTGEPISWRYDFRDIDFSRHIKDSPFSFGFDYAYELPQGIQGPPYIAFENGLLDGKPQKLKIWEEGTHGNSIILKTGFGTPDWDSSKIGPILTYKAIQFIDRHISNNQTSGRRKPFFMHYCTESCHKPHTPPQELDGVKIKGAAGDAHLDMLLEADVTLGKMIERLRHHGELDNTLILFVSDNGGLSRGKPGAQRLGHDSCGGLRGSKASIWEGGHRIPMIARWGDGTPTGSIIAPGSRSDALVGLQDIYATFANLTGQAVDSKQGLDSESFLPVLNGGHLGSIRKSLFVQANAEPRYGQRLAKMVRMGDWKLVTSREQEPLHLFNLASDLTETNDLLNDEKQQTRVSQMRAELKRIVETARSTEPLPVSIFKPTISATDSKIHSDSANQVHTDELFQPAQTLKLRISDQSAGNIKRAGDHWIVQGTSPLSIEFVPDDGERWDISKFRLVGVPLLNRESGVTIVDGKLNNSDVTGWSRHCVGFGVAPSKEASMLGFVFPQEESTYQGPDVFRDQLSKPDGHRMHWRRFYPADVRTLKLDIQSSTGKVDLQISDPVVCWEATQERDKALHAMPYLDELGQVNSLDWPGKIKQVSDLKATLLEELASAKLTANSKNWTRFGGWKDGPKQNATGHFRTEKVAGRWWLIDPEGYLFFSVGVCLAGDESATPLTQTRRESGFFEWLPDEGHNLRWTGLKKNQGREFVNFPAMNYARALGPNWKKISRDGIHHRMRAWGINTLGSWSSKPLQEDAKTAYTLIASIWWQAGKKLPSPFRDDYESDLRKCLEKFAAAKDDPYCLGLFLGNEFEWPDRLTPVIFEMPDDESTKQWVLKQLKEKYSSLEELNLAWETNHAQWDTVLKSESTKIPAAARNDIEPYYYDFANAFFAKSKKVMNEVLPNKLFLGCRCHRGPNVLGRAAAGHADIFSVNVYDSTVRAWQVPANVDMPILAGEFHIGSVDRGVPSPGLASAWNQRQRGLAFSNYLSTALADPRFVGIHWFQWIDQSAAGRKDRENHQCGFVDVTGRSYPEFVHSVAHATQQMYQARTDNNANRLKILGELIAPPRKVSPTDQPAPMKNQSTKMLLPAQTNTPLPKNSVTEQSGEYWKNKFFERFPNADTNGDGTLSWQEFKVHKKKIETENSDHDK